MINNNKTKDYKSLTFAKNIVFTYTTHFVKKTKWPRTNKTRNKQLVRTNS